MRYWHIEKHCGNFFCGLLTIKHEKMRNINDQEVERYRKKVIE